MLEESIERAEEDVRERQLREARVDAEGILAATRRELAAHAALLEPGEPEAIAAAMAELEAAAAGEDPVRIRDAYDALSRITEPFARRIMDRALADAMVNRPVEEL
jgi:molecular chaperone HscA